MDLPSSLTTSKGAKKFSEGKLRGKETEGFTMTKMAQMAIRNCSDQNLIGVKSTSCTTACTSTGKNAKIVRIMLRVKSASLK